MRKNIKKCSGMLLIALVLSILYKPLDVNACYLLYAGGDMTDDGMNMIMRNEEMFSDTNKLFFISPAGRFKKGDVCSGCNEFSWTFTHDSYKYTACSDGRYKGVCENCGDSDEHVANESAGTNEFGLTVCATVSLDASEKMRETDPYTEDGIDESILTTVLLSEASNAREGVELLAGIYDSKGAAIEGSGLFICDQHEQWYMENLSGHEYVALLLPPNVTFLQYTTSVIGRIDLDDTENIIASDHLFSVAKKAGTFVGDESENIIDFRSSFNDYLMERDDAETWNAEWTELCKIRLAATLNFLEKTSEWNKDNVLADNDFIMTNLDRKGRIVPIHNNLDLKMSMTKENVLELLRMIPNSNEENLNTHIFRFYPGEEAVFGTEEWSTFDNCRYNVFVPSYPMLLTDTWEGYRVELKKAEITDAKPDKGDYYLCEGKYHINSEGWEESYTGTLSALANLLDHENLSREEKELAEKNFWRLQKEYFSEFEEISGGLKAEKSITAKEKMMTDAHEEMSKGVHDLALALYRFYKYGEKSELINFE